MTPPSPLQPLSIRRIVLPTDFSVCAERALPRALAMAEQFDAEIHLLHVLSALGTGDGPDADELHSWREESARTRLEATRMAYRYGLPGAHAARMELVVVRNGQPADAITRYASTHDADLIVMGTHGRSFRRDTTMGGITAAVLRGARCPVMTVSAFRQSTGMIRQVLAVVTEHDMTPAVLHYAANLSAAFDAHLTVLGASPDADDESAAAPFAPSLRELLQEAGLPPTIPVQWLEPPLAATLSHRATQIDADLIVMPAHLHDNQGPDQAYQIVRSVAGSVLALERPSTSVSERSRPQQRQRPKPSPRART